MTENASFIVDIDAVSFQDLKADDLGSWNATGTKKSYFRFQPSGTLRVSDKRPATNPSDYYTMTRRYYVHKTYARFHRQIVDIKGDKRSRKHVVWLYYKARISVLVMHGS